MKTVRLQFTIDEDELKKIEGLMQNLGLKRRAALFSYALSLLGWATKERGRGRIIVSMDEEKGTYKELEMPMWS